MTCEACKDRLVKSELQIKSLERILERAKGLEQTNQQLEKHIIFKLYLNLYPQRYPQSIEALKSSNYLCR